MKRSEVNKDPERAKKRATSDLRCAVNKLGISEALRIIANMPDASLTVRKGLHGVRIKLSIEADQDTWRRQCE